MRTLHFGLIALVAVILVLGSAGIGMADETKGKFKNVLADKETFVVTENDKDHTFKLDAKAKILINDRESKLSDLKANDNVTVTWRDQDGARIASMIVCKRE
jgi:hypothetical protein